MALDLQKALKSVVDKGDALEAAINARAEGQRIPTAEEAAQLNTLASEADNLTKQIGNQKSLAAAKKFGEQSSGTVAGAVFAGDTYGDTDAPGDLSSIASTPEGELYSLTGTSNKKLELLKSGEYKDAFNDFMRVQASGGKRAMKAASMKVLSETGFSAGEAWLPPDYRAELIKKIATVTSVRRNASVYTTGTDIVTFPAVHYTTDDKYTSGVRFSWRGSAVQTSAITEATNPTSGQIKIPVNLATASIILQRELFEDAAFDILGYVTQLGTEAFALGEEDAFTSGDGLGAPQGFIYHPSAHIAFASTSTVAGLSYQGRACPSSASSTIGWGDAGTPEGILGTEANLAPQYEPGAKWFANKKTYAYIRSINSGTATLPQWSLGDSWPNYANGMNMSLLGYNCEKNQFLGEVATGNNEIPLVLADMKGYYIMDRVGLTVEVNPWVYQLQDQVVVYMRKRTGGQLVHYWKFAFLQCSPTVG